MNLSNFSASLRAIQSHLDGLMTQNSSAPDSSSASRGEPKISLHNVSRFYRREKGEPVVALQDIDLAVRPGEFLCIVGPSGCGKSTLLHMVAGLDRPSTGEIRLNGRPVQEPGPDRILIFQDLGLFPWLTVLENVEFGMRMKGVKKDEMHARARRYLNLVHLSQFEESYIHQLSGGMRQRVALARALAIQPDVLLMDEPFAALDAQTRDRLHDELERIWSETGQTIIFVTHNVREAARLGDRIIVLTFRPGRIKTEIRSDLSRPRNMEDPHVVLVAGQVMDQLRGEIDRSLQSEYQSEKNT